MGSRILKWLVLLVAIVSCFFVDYTSLLFSNNMIPYLLIIASIIAFAILLVSEQAPLKDKGRLRIARIVFILSCLGVVVGGLMMVIQARSGNVEKGLFFTTIAALLICTSMLLTIRDVKKKANSSE